MKSIKLIFKSLLAVLMLASVTAAFFGVPYAEYACRVQPGSAVAFVVVLALTPILGRFFCETMCPLGILQTLVNYFFHPKTHVRRVCTRLPVTRAQKVVRITILLAMLGLLAGGLGGLAWSLTPYSIYGKALAGGTLGLILAAVALVTAAVGRGRFWCNWICPIGSLFTLLSRRSVCSHQVGKGCANCRRCFPVSASSAAVKPAEVEEGLTRREAIQGVALFAAVEAVDKTTDGGYAPIVLHGEVERQRSVLPPGAISRAKFSRKCVGCELCVKRCPGKCLKPSLKLATFGQPVMDFVHGHCILGCTACSDVCPETALERLTEEEKLNTHIGYACWYAERCIRQDGTRCLACLTKCPVGAIHEVGDQLVVDRDRCIGCGACEHVCAAKPLPAIVVEGLDEQRTVRPIGAADLEREMVELVKGGESVVVAKDGVIVRREKGSGVKPILDLLDADALKDALVVDKIVGRAAAAVCVLGGARKVVGLVMSTGAKAYLNAHGVSAEAFQLVEKIVNRKGDGQCPMEEQVKDLAEPAEMVDVLKKAVRK